MEPWANPEKLSIFEHAFIKTNLGPVQSAICRINEIDRTRGKARIPNGRCFWLRTGERVSIQKIDDGGHVAAVSSTPDPTAPGTGLYEDK